MDVLLAWIFPPFLLISVIRVGTYLSKQLSKIMAPLYIQHYIYNVYGYGEHGKHVIPYVLPQSNEKQRNV